MIDKLAFLIILMIIGLSVVYSLKDLRDDKSSIGSVDKVIYYLSVFFSFLIMIVNLKFIYVRIVKFASLNLNITSAIAMSVFKIFVLLITFSIIQILISKALKLAIVILYHIIENDHLPTIIHYLLSIIFGVLKGVIILFILFLCISSYNNTFTYKRQISIFNNNNFYSILDRYIKNNKSVILYNDIKEYVPEGSVDVFYNGVPLNHGIESNSDIDKKSKELTHILSSDREKARALYVWIGKNIEYDYKKAEDVLSGNITYDSGANVAFEERSGICFDYACLFIAMANSIDMPVRLITGEANNGISFGPHAWNQVYLKDEQKWINVDCTFYSSGEYFDTINFSLDHVPEEIAGEWGI